MRSDLIVITFDREEMAETVYHALQAMRKNRVLGLGDSVILTRGGDGQVRPHPGAQTDAGLAGLLARLIFQSPEGVEPALAGVKLDEEFTATVVSALGACGSALLLFLDSDDLSDASELLHALALFRGTIHQTTLSPQSEDLLRSML